MWRPSPDRLAQFERLPDDLADPPARQIIALGDRLAAPSAQRALHDPMPADFPLDRADAGGGAGVAGSAMAGLLLPRCELAP
jgi:hypothetical protein